MQTGSTVLTGPDAQGWTPDQEKGSDPMEDREMFRLLQERQEILERIEALQARADKRKEKIVAEMERRGIKALENDKFRVSYVQQERVDYSLDALKNSLTPALFRRITKPVVDREALSGMVQMGKVSAEVVADCSTITTSKPYIVVKSKSNGNGGR